MRPIDKQLDWHGDRDETRKRNCEKYKIVLGEKEEEEETIDCDDDWNEDEQEGAENFTECRQLLLLKNERQKWNCERRRMTMLMTGKRKL